MRIPRRPVGAVVAALAATVLLTGAAPAPVARTAPVPAAEPAPAAVPAAVPEPSPTGSVVTVRTGGDRSGGLDVTALQGVRLGLFAAEGDPAPVAGDWATCVSDGAGDCSFEVPDTASGGANAGARFYVKQLDGGAPAGWFTNPALRTGKGSGSGSVESAYAFRTPELAAGRTYSSTRDFMHSTDYATAPYTASGGVWQNSRNNPALPESCGLDVALDLDLSASVGSALPALKRAADTMTDALAGTPSRMSVFSFDRGSPSAGADVNHPELTPVSTQAGADRFKAQYADWQLGKGTNWDQGLNAVARADQKYDLVIVLTDGNPTYWGEPRQGDGSNTHFADVEGGIFAANSVKREGTRVVAVGVGAGVAGVSGRNLRALSGPEAYDGSNPTTADHFQTTDFETAGQALQDLALTHCEGTLSVIKQLVPAGNQGEDVSGSVLAGGGWRFTASTGTPGVGGLPDTQTTSDARAVGGVVFHSTFPSDTSSADVSVEEAQRPGHTLVTQGGKNAVCTNLDDDTPVPVTNAGTASHPSFTVDVPRLAAVSCVVHNRPTTARLTLVKEVSNAHGGSALPTDWLLSADGAAGDRIAGSTGTAPVTGSTVPAGGYTLGERGPEGYDTSGWRCVGADGALPVRDGRLELAAGDDVTCTVRNTDRPLAAPSPSPSSSPSGASPPSPSPHPSQDGGERPPGSLGETGANGLLAFGALALLAGGALLLWYVRRRRAGL